MVETPSISELRKGLGLIQVYTGDGKGKTTAALGLALRAVGNGLRVLMVQFMKTAQATGEYEASKRLPGFELIAMGREKMVEPGRPSDEDIRSGVNTLGKVKKALMSAEYDLIILDEINVAMAWGVVDETAVISMLMDRPSHIEVVLTGRYAPKRIIEMADLVSEMRCVKHPFHCGTPARAGIEM